MSRWLMSGCSFVRAPVRQAVQDATAQRDAELAHAFDVAMSEIVSQEKQAMEPFFSQSDWRVDDLVVSELELHPRAGGRLVEVTGPGRRPALRGSAVDEQIELELTVSHLETATGDSPTTWTIVR